MGIIVTLLRAISVESCGAEDRLKWVEVKKWRQKCRQFKKFVFNGWSEIVQKLRRLRDPGGFTYLFEHRRL